MLELVGPKAESVTAAHVMGLLRKSGALYPLMHLDPSERLKDSRIAWLVLCITMRLCCVEGGKLGGPQRRSAHLHSHCRTRSPSRIYLDR